MRVRIHRGTKEIGGNCIELSSGGKTLVLDMGMPLTAPDPASVALASSGRIYAMRVRAGRRFAYSLNCSRKRTFDER